MAGDKEGGKGEAEEGELLQNFEARLKERLPYLQQRINFHERRLKGEVGLWVRESTPPNGELLCRRGRHGDSSAALHGCAGLRGS